jgi:hypothetical protein
MARISRGACAVVLFIAAMWGTAAAEKTIPVNVGNTGLFDQPSVVMNGSAANVAFIGDDTASGTFRVFFAAVNGAADFSNLSLPDNTFLLISPVVIDNTGAPGNSPYFDARHPKIALRSATEVVILFQARPAAADDFYRPYIARLAVTANSAALTSVRQVEGFPAGDIEDISYNLVLTDNTARMAFANRPAISSTSPFQVHFARVGLDNASVVRTFPLSSGDNNTVTGSDGFRPVPSLRLDPLGNAHVAWAANDNTPNPGGVYYAMVTSFPANDNVGIGATEVLGRTLSWGHPSLLAPATNSIIVLAADESIPGRAGNIGIVSLNPDAVVKNGLPVSIGTARSFLAIGPAVLPSTFDLYRPEAFRDGNGNIHLTGYGNSGTTATYYVFQLSAGSPFGTFVTVPLSVGFNEFPAELASDYTKAAFGVLPGKTVIFWSGLIPGSTNRNLNVTSVPNNIIITAEEEGCSMVGNPRAGEAGRIPGTALLFLPAVALAVRRFSQRIRRRLGSGVAD